MQLEICDINIDFQLICPPRLERQIEKRYGKFKAKDMHKSLYKFCLRAVKNEFRNQIRKGEIYETNRFMYFSGQQFLCKLDKKEKKAEGKISESIHSFENLLRLIISRFIVDRNGFLIHSSGVVSGKNGYIFFGRSGAGKTTLTSKFPKNKILSDEIIGVRKNNAGGWLIYSTPFWGELKLPTTNIKAKVKKVFYLTQGKELKIQHISKPLLLRSLLKCIISYDANFILTPKLLKLATDFVRQNKTGILSFSLFNRYQEILRVVGSY